MQFHHLHNLSSYSVCVRSLHSCDTLLLHSMGVAVLLHYTCTSLSAGLQFSPEKLCIAALQPWLQKCNFTIPQDPYISGLLL